MKKSLSERLKNMGPAAIITSAFIGPGTITVAHKPNESVELEQLEKTCAVDEAVIRALLR